MAAPLRLVRRTDPQSAFEGARKALEGLKGYKGKVLRFMYEESMVADTNGHGPYAATARDIAELLYHQGYITLHQIDTARRRVSDLHRMGLLDRVDCGSDPAMYVLAGVTKPQF